MIEKDLQNPPDHYYKLLLEGYKNWGLDMEKLKEAKDETLEKRE